MHSFSQESYRHLFELLIKSPQSQGVMDPVIPDRLRLKVDQTFGSMSAMRSLIFQTAMSIHGSGWVWLVVGPNSDLRVLATYNAGTPFNVRSRQIQDPNTAWNLDSSGKGAAQQVEGLRPNRRHEYLILPVLGLNCWEHAYLPDYGVLGKAQYLKNWWASVNWQRVNEAIGRRNMNARVVRN